MPGHGQPKGSRQHHDVSPGALLRSAVLLSIGQYLPQVTAAGSITAGLVPTGFPGREFPGRERGDLESAQYRLPVLAEQPPNLGHVGGQFPCRVPAVQASRHEQVEEPLPGFWQRGHDLLKPVLQRCPPGRPLVHVGNVVSDVTAHGRPVEENAPGGGDRRIRVRP